MSVSEWLRPDSYSVSDYDYIVLSICNMKGKGSLSVPSNLKLHERETPASKYSFVMCHALLNRQIHVQSKFRIESKFLRARNLLDKGSNID